MFEKSLVDLIRGLRNHKGQESEYIQSAIKECRSEIRSQDLDLKATALLKLIYLEMFGYDMTWAAFNVLEVMASPKAMQKRVGYLAAVQSFRPETEVLMLAENLLKKDLTSPAIPILSLPLVTLPHIVTSSLALSILTDLLPRLSHSQPAVRKKTIVTLYRLALVYPETLRVAWPKIKERLLDPDEDGSVTAATVNVVCELGFRRPQDFLPLAPRLFDLLLAQKNNWMGIKIIKLFAVLTPLEPRLVRKLVRPLTKLIQETTAMSLLYECISGIIQGGILDGADSGVDVEEVADLCISKLRGMIVLDGDPNLKYVALLAFNKIVVSHAGLVALQQDVILACLEDPDISIKMQALELISGMVNRDNLQDVVNRLMKQLANAPATDDAANGHVDDGQTDLEQRLVPDPRSSETAPLSDEYRHEIIGRVLDMCSGHTYANITDFEWYIDILVHLVRHLPADRTRPDPRTSTPDSHTLGARVGAQLRDVAVRVKELRPETTRAAETLVLVSNRPLVYPRHGGGQSEVLRSAAWVCGEFAQDLADPYETLNSLIHPTSEHLSPAALAIFVQAIPKIIAHIATTANREWNASRGSTLSLLLARTTEFLARLSSHPNLEVQERSVEFLELLRLAFEALNHQARENVEAPLLLTSAMPALFSAMDLNPVSAAAQGKVPVPSDLDLDSAINPELPTILQASQVADAADADDDAFHAFYYDREPDKPSTSLHAQPAAALLDAAAAAESESLSYQSAPESPATVARRKAEKAARNRDDPFYIAPSGDYSPNFHEIISKTNDGDELDVESIPIIDLQIDPSQTIATQFQAANDAGQHEAPRPRRKKPVRKFVIAADETLEPSVTPPMSQSLSHTPRASTPTYPRPRSLSPNPQSRTATAAAAAKAPVRSTRQLLTVDSSTLEGLSLEGHGDGNTPSEILRREAEEMEMAIALREVERKRLEMQRALERQQTTLGEGVDVEGTVVRRKKKKARPVAGGDDTGAADPAMAATTTHDGESAVKKKKKKKKKVKITTESSMDEPGAAEQTAKYS